MIVRKYAERPKGAAFPLSFDFLSFSAELGAVRPTQKKSGGPQCAK
jgi:hypothetical protein